MRGATLLLLFIVMAPSVDADPAWLTPNMKASDCDAVFWKHQGMCFVEYNRQHLERLKAYIRNEIEHTKAGSCDNDELLQVFEDREAAWNEYSQKYCALQIYCVGHCGSGHSAEINNCNASMSDLRRKFLENEVVNGLQIWGCSIKGASKGKTLVTENYEVRLVGNCESGLFACDRVTYHGVHRHNRSRISLDGSVIMQLDEEKFIEMPVGYIFTNGDIEYLVTNAGTLKVTDNRQGTVLLEETGYWQ